jgi:hypothetical protein
VGSAEILCGGGKPGDAGAVTELATELAAYECANFVGVS